MKLNSKVNICGKKKKNLSIFSLQIPEEERMMTGISDRNTISQ